MEKGTALKDYASGEELIAEIRKRAELFIAEFDDVPASGLHTLKDGVDRTPAQMLAYQLGWMDLLLGWEEGERAGREVVTPAPGYRWNRLGDLYSTFYEQWSGRLAASASGGLSEQGRRRRRPRGIAEPGGALHLRAAGVGLLDAVGLAGGQVGAYQHGGALHLLPHEDPRLETPLSAAERHRGQDTIHGGHRRLRWPP